MPQIAIIHKKCTSCGLCVEVCPREYFAQPDKAVPPEVIEPRECISCGHCVAICPTGAVDHSQFPNGVVRPINRDLLPGPEQLMEALRNRRSIREFKDTPVDRELLSQVIASAQLAPSAHNNQSTEYVVVTDRAMTQRMVELTAQFLAKTAKQLRNPILRRIMTLLARDEVKGALEMLDDFERVVTETKKGKDPVLHDAPAVILFHGAKTDTYSYANAQLAIQNAALMAASLGLGAFYTGYLVAACLRERKIPELLGIPKDCGIHCGLAVGWPRLKYSKWPPKGAAKVKWK